MKIVKIALTALTTALLITCEQVPDYCGRGEIYDPSCEFCYGSHAYVMCGKDTYNPLIAGCDADNRVGTRCSDGSIVPSGTPCGGYTLTIAATPEDGGRVENYSSTTNFKAGDVVDLIASPANDEYILAGWAGRQPSATAKFGDKTKATYKMTGNMPNITIVAVFRYTGKGKLETDVFPKGSGSVSRSRDPDAETGKYPEGTSVTVTAAANGGYTFAGWSGSDSSKTNPLTVTISDSKTLVAMFEPVIRTVIVKVEPSDGGAVFINSNAIAGSNTSQKVGTEIVVFAKENDKEGFVFNGWTGIKAVFADRNSQSTTVKLESDGATITANFKRGSGGGGTMQKTTYTLTVDVDEGGKVTMSHGEPNYVSGTPVTVGLGANVTITAAPKDGMHEFVKWSSDNKTIGSDSAITVLMSEDKRIRAEFRQIEKDTTPTTPNDTKYKVTVYSAGIYDGNDKSGEGDYAVGEMVTIYAGNAPTGQQFKNWTVTEGGVTLATTETAQFYMPAKDVAVRAEFRQIENDTTPTTPNDTKYKVTVYSAGIYDGNDKSGEGDYAVGEMVTIYAGNAPTDQQFKNWTTPSGSGVVFTNASSVATTFIMPANAVTVTARFENTSPICNNCVNVSFTIPSGAWKLSDFDTAPQNMNAMGNDWYFYSDVDIGGTSSVVSGGWLMEDEYQDGRGVLDIAGNAIGFNGSDGAFIEFEFGSPVTYQGNVLMPFVGIGTEIFLRGLGQNMVLYNAGEAENAGLYFVYRTHGVTTLYIEVYDKYAMDNPNVGNVYFVELPEASYGTWKSATIPFSRLCLPAWSQRTEAFNKGAIGKIHFKVSGSTSGGGAFFIDNVYIIGER